MSPDYIIRGEEITTSLCRVSSDTLAAGTEDGLVKLFSTVIMRPTSSWQAHKGSVLGLEQVDDCILSQGREGALHLWKDGRRVKHCALPSTGFCQFSLSADQRHCYVGLDQKSQVACIDMKSFSTIRTFQPSDYDKRGMSWCVKHSGDKLYVGYESGDLVVFDTRLHAKQLLSVKLHDEIITTMDVREDLLYTSSPDGTLKITSLQKTECNHPESSDPSLESVYEHSNSRLSSDVLHTIELKTKSSSRVRVRPDGKLFVAAGWDGGVRLYSCRKYEMLGLVDAHSPDTITDMIVWDNKVACCGRDKKISFWTFY